MCQYLGMEAPDMPCHGVVLAGPSGLQPETASSAALRWLPGPTDLPSLLRLRDPKFDRGVQPVIRELHNPIAQRVSRAPSLEDSPGVTIDRLAAIVIRYFSRSTQATGATGKRGDAKNLDHFQRKRLALFTSNRALAAFDLSTEPAAVRDFVRHFALRHECSIARRLVEAGVTFVAVTTESRAGATGTPTATILGCSSHSICRTSIRPARPWSKTSIVADCSTQPWW